MERDSPPPGTFPRKLAGPRRPNGKQFQPPHGVFIPDQASRGTVQGGHQRGKRGNVMDLQKTSGKIHGK